MLQNWSTLQRMLLFLSWAHYSFSFNSRFLYKLKHKVRLSKSLCWIFPLWFCFVFIKDTTALTKSMNMDIGAVGTWNQLYERFLDGNQIFKKHYREARFFVINPFCTPHIICLNICFWYISYGNIAFSILGLSIKSGTSIFMIKVFVF